MLERYLPQFLAFFFPAVYAAVDLARGYEFLEQELHQVTKHAAVGRRLVDKLVKVWLRDGTETWVLIHVEVQGTRETNFGWRMYLYHHLLLLQHDRPVVSLAVLVDRWPDWRPTGYEREFLGNQIRFVFPIVKLLDYRERRAELEADGNPFATVVMAHLVLLETRRKPAERASAKLALTRRLYERGYRREDVVGLYRFIDWVLRLPPEWEAATLAEIKRYEEGRQMPYVSSAERIGRAEGLQTAIAQGLDVKFGAAAQETLAEIQAILDPKLLEAILRRLWTAESLDDVRQVYAGRNRA